MRPVFCLFLLLGSPLMAQPAAALANLNETLHAMARPGAASAPLSARLVDEMLSLAPSDRQPSRGALAGFANVFTAALLGKDLTEARVATFERCIADVLSGSGTNLKPAKLLRDTLTAIGISEPRTQSIITRFIEVGEEVRGPDDSPVALVK
jgi:hypothetical protein